MNLKKKIILVCFFLLFSVHAKAGTDTISIDTNKTADDSDRQRFGATDKTLTISNSASISFDGASSAIDINEKNNSTIIIESGSTVEITGTGSNAIQADGQDNAIITNSGTISAARSKALNLLNANSSTVTNKSSSTIKSNTNAISITVTGENTSDLNTIDNYGKIFTESTTDENNAIKMDGSTSLTTINNYAGGHIYNQAAGGIINGSTIYMNGISNTLQNKGTIENKNSKDQYAIAIDGLSNTLSLNEGSLVIGKINISGSDHFIDIAHGFGQSYFYETTGSGTYTVTDFDRNNAVKGSTGSVSQGGNEILDEILSYKSLNLRQSFLEFNKKSKENKKWGEINFASFNRKGNDKDFGIGFNYSDLNINLINNINDKNFVVSLNSGKQQFSKKHDINRYSLHSGLYLFDENNSGIVDNESFFVGGVSLHDSTRTILSNASSTGKLDLKDLYYSFEVLSGLKKNFEKIPNIGTTFSASFTPSHNEFYYQWKDKHAANISFYLDDQYNFNFDKQNSINLGWVLDLRQTFDTKQSYTIKNISTSYEQDDDLKQEATLIATIGYDKKISEDHFLTFSLNGSQSTQELITFSGNIAYKFAF